MFYIGIDIGKRNHEVGLIDDQVNPVGKTVRVANSKEGSEKLLQFINQHKLTPDNSVVGLEATGHYWLSVFSFLHKLGFKTTVFNPYNLMPYGIFIFVKQKQMLVMFILFF